MSNPVLEISRTGMDVEYRRVEVVANNIANAGTTRTAEGEAFVPMRLVSGPKVAGAAGANTPSFRVSLPGVQVYGVERTALAPRQVYEPSHPHADARGYVSMPGIDQVGEMTTLLKAVRSYEANIAVFNATRSMYLKAIELGGRQ
jgi:flagellar basal-body rod protein FlgC